MHTCFKLGEMLPQDHAALPMVQKLLHPAGKHSPLGAATYPCHRESSLPLAAAVPCSCRAATPPPPQQQESVFSSSFQRELRLPVNKFSGVRRCRQQTWVALRDVWERCEQQQRVMLELLKKLFPITVSQLFGDCSFNHFSLFNTSSKQTGHSLLRNRY